MTSYLVDTGILLRLVDRTDPHHPAIREALRRLKALGADLVTTAQNHSEFWNVCTRPATARGGLGMNPSEADGKLRLLERAFRMLPESPGAYSVWRRLVVQHSVIGVQAHDARLVAGMLTNGVNRILTLNPADFSRYAGIVALTPDQVRNEPALQ